MNPSDHLAVDAYVDADFACTWTSKKQKTLLVLDLPQAMWLHSVDVHLPGPPSSQRKSVSSMMAKYVALSVCLCEGPVEGIVSSPASHTPICKNQWMLTRRSEWESLSSILQHGLSSDSSTHVVLPFFVTLPPLSCPTFSLLLFLVVANNSYSSSSFLIYTEDHLSVVADASSMVSNLSAAVDQFFVTILYLNIPTLLLIVLNSIQLHGMLALSLIILFL